MQTVYCMLWYTAYTCDWCTGRNLCVCLWEFSGINSFSWGLGALWGPAAGHILWVPGVGKDPEVQRSSSAAWWEIEGYHYKGSKHTPSCTQSSTNVSVATLSRPCHRRVLPQGDVLFFSHLIAVTCIDSLSFFSYVQKHGAVHAKTHTEHTHWTPFYWSHHRQVKFKAYFLSKHHFL